MDEINKVPTFGSTEEMNGSEKEQPGVPQGMQQPGEPQFGAEPQFGEAPQFGAEPQFGEALRFGAEQGVQQYGMPQPGVQPPRTGQYVRQSGFEQNMQQGAPALSSFDPNTGEPIYGGANNGSYAADDYSGYGGYGGGGYGGYGGYGGGGYGAGAMEEKPRRKTGLIIGIVALIIALALGGLYLLGSASGMINKDLLDGMEKSVKESELLSAINIADYKDYEKVTADVSIKINGNMTPYDIALNYSLDTKEKWFGGEVSLNSNGSTFSGSYFGDESELLFKVNQWMGINLNAVAKYSYNQPMEGYLYDILVDQNGKKAADNLLNTLRQGIEYFANISSSNGRVEEYSQKMKDVLKKHFNALKFEKIEAASFTVDGESRDCVGYETVITGETVKAVLADLEKVQSEYAGDAGLSTGGDLGMTDFDVSTFKDMKMQIYSSGGKTAAVVLNTEIIGYEAAITFSFPKDNKLSASVSVSGQKIVFDAEYAKKSGTLLLVAKMGQMEIFSHEMKVVREKDSIFIDTGNVVLGTNELHLVIDVKAVDSLTKPEIDAGGALDVNKATKEEFDSFIAKIFGGM